VRYEADIAALYLRRRLRVGIIKDDPEPVPELAAIRRHHVAGVQFKLHLGELPGPFMNLRLFMMNFAHWPPRFGFGSKSGA
jgi:hypothetical protein